MTAQNRQPLAVVDLGRTAYVDCWTYQQDLLEERIGGALPDMLLLTEHDHVYTIGTAGEPAHVLASRAELTALGASVVNTDRGGDVTYHGPGQLVAYPILDLEQHRKDLHWYLRALEESIIRLLGHYGLEASRSEPYTGVWVGNEKICAIGVRTRRWVTMHGFALNVNTEMSYFSSIVPCGIMHRGVTSMAALLGSPIAMTDVARDLVAEFASIFGLDPDAVERGVIPPYPSSLREGLRRTASLPVQEMKQ